jgi:hypothetical protein
LVYIEENRKQLILVPGILKYFSDFGVPVEKFKAGDLRYLKMAERVLGYLSLQGRTRLNVGLSIRVDEDEHALILSKTLKPAYARAAKSFVRDFEETLGRALGGEEKNLIIGVLPSSYLKKFKAKPQPIQSCTDLLVLM